MRLLPLQVALTLLTFVAAAGLFVSGGSAAIVSYHIVFAIGILPLILAAMVHFVPVLTRSGASGPGLRLVPLAALAGGLLVTLFFSYPQLAPFAHYAGALLAAGAVAALAGWAWRLRRKTLGTPHPCLDWYLAALACLFAALCAILAGHWLPGQRPALRLLHLHLNTLGFIGITALGTLQVLLPTAAQQPDSASSLRMRRSLRWVVAGTLLTAGAAAWLPALAGMGLLLLGIPLVAIMHAWWQLYPGRIFARHGALPPLAAALGGYAITLLLGALHGYLQLDLYPVDAFLIAFLMPLVTGAAGYLLPLWLRPGRLTAWHQAVRRQLEFGSGARALALLAGGLMAGLGFGAGWYLALFAVGTFAFQALLALTRAAGRTA